MRCIRLVLWRQLSTIVGAPCVATNAYHVVSPPWNRESAMPSYRSQTLDKERVSFNTTLSSCRLHQRWRRLSTTTGSSRKSSCWTMA